MPTCTAKPFNGQEMSEKELAEIIRVLPKDPGGAVAYEDIVLYLNIKRMAEGKDGKDED